MSQFLFDGFGKPFRLDRNTYGGSLLIYVRSDIPCKQLNNRGWGQRVIFQNQVTTKFFDAFVPQICQNTHFLHFSKYISKL